MLVIQHELRILRKLKVYALVNWNPDPPADQREMQGKYKRGIAMEKITFNSGVDLEKVKTFANGLEPIK